MFLKRWFDHVVAFALASALACAAPASAERAQHQQALQPVIPLAISQALADASAASHAANAGLMTESDAAVAATAAVERLTAAWTELEGAKPEIVLLANKVAILELAQSAVPLMVIPSQATDPQLAQAIVEWVEASARVLSNAWEPEGPRNPCMTRLVLCLAYCSTAPNWVLRASCALDCELDLLNCVGEVLAPIVGSVLESAEGLPGFP